jgi:hypothetical protein
MNLVAKEFIAARPDELGVLILSRFTGAARELADALLVNPYDIEQMAEAIRTALEMDIEEQKARMQRMRRVVRDNNIYRWASTLISELCEVRLDEPANRLEPSPQGPRPADVILIDQSVEDFRQPSRGSAAGSAVGSQSPILFRVGRPKSHRFPRSL